MPITKDEILAEIRKLVASNNEVPGEASFTSATRIKVSAWKGRFWARWADAVREAGFDPLAMTAKIPDEDMLKSLAVLVTTLGQFPVRDEINIHSRTTPGLPHWTTVKKRFGGMPQLAKALSEYGRQCGNAELVKLCEARLQLETLKPASKPAVNHQAKLGYVYLKYSPSLRLYKIGKADDPDKRGFGIGLLLPEDLVAKHQIRTDYPYILEKYWEHRFRAKKRQGEWYALSATDIEAFKKRREFLFSEFFP